MLLGEVVILSLLLYIGFSLHEEFFCKPLRGLFMGGTREFKPQVQKVAEFVVLENVNEG